MFISSAFAQTAAPAGGASDAMLQLLPIVLIFVVFYFLLIRPQQKKMKQHRDMLAAIRRGDRVVTGGGIIGSVTKVVDDNELQVEIAEGVRVRVQRAMVSAVLAKPEPANDPKDTPRSDGGAAAGDGAGKPEAPQSSSRLTRILGGKRD